MHEGTEIELTLTGMAYGGEAFGRAEDGRMVFVPFALPEERVRVRLTEVRKRWARGLPTEWLLESPRRIAPRCPHFGICGGCHYQHLPYSEQLVLKRDILVDQLERIGGLDSPPVEATRPSPYPWAYRNNMTFQITSQGSLGFVRHDGEGLFPVEACHLADPALEELRTQITLEADAGVSKLGLRIGSQGPPMVILHGEGLPDLEAQVEIPASVVWLTPEGSIILAGEDHLSFDIEGHRFRVSPGSFFQVNLGLVPELIQQALEMLSPAPGQKVRELYAGVGLFTRFLLEAGAEVIAVEESRTACADFRTNLAAEPNARLIEASVEQALSGLEQSPPAVLLDPPRAGLSPAAREALLRLEPERIVYVSCDPATLARDAKAFIRHGYRLARALPVDMFPQTYHIESVSQWVR